MIKLIFKGVIHSTYLDERIIGVIINKRLKFFYLQNNLLKKFKRYLYKGRFVSFDYSLESKIINKKKAYIVNHFISITKNKGFYKKEVYYDIEVIRDAVKELINKKKYKLFLDLEMTMQDFRMPKNFVSEIIQAGIILVDENDEIIKKVNYRIKPSKFPISKRTRKFLNIFDEDEDTWFKYKDFYNIFKDIIKKYKPNIFVWGKNDLVTLKNSYIINKKSSLEFKTNFINLLQVIKNYYNIKNDLGLLKAFNMFTDEELIDQAHDALEDALITYKIFLGFKRAINRENKK